MFDLVNNASLLVYIWGIYGSIELTVGLFTSLLLMSSALFILCNLLFSVLEGEDKPTFFKLFPKKTLYYFTVLFMVLDILLPNKEYLPYIISASPVAKAIVSSYEDGKLQKVDAILDKSLDKALKYLEDNTSKQED